MDSKEKEKESQNKSGVDYSFPISEYAKQLDFPVRDRYLQKIAAIGIDPVLVEGKDFKPDCLPPVESTDILCYLVLETSFLTQKQFKAFRSLEAYNQMVSGFIASVQGHIIRFWRTCILPEVLGRWYTRKHDFGDVKPMEAYCVCFCRTVTAEDTVSCCNANCPILKFHLSCLGICSIPKTWYCPNLTKPVISKELKELVEALLGPNFQGISNIPVQQQMNVSDCGVFAIAFATCLVYGQNPCNVIFDIPRMRQHLHRCLRTGMMQLFPTT